MAIDLYVNIDDRYNQKYPSVSLYEEVVEYLHGLGEFSSRSRLFLYSLDQYGDAVINNPKVADLLVDIRRLVPLVAERQIEAPPEKVDREFCGESFGWQGLSVFLKQFIVLLEFAIAHDHSILAIGD